MKQYTIETFEFDELSETAKETALEKMCDINVDYEWFRDTIDFIKNEYLPKKGLMCRDIFFDIDRGSIKFTNFDFNDQDLFLDNFLMNSDTFIVELDKFDGMSEELYTVNESGIEYYCDCENNEKPFIDTSLENDIDNYLSDIKEHCLTILRKEYEWLTSKEAVIETIKANEYEFTIDGIQY